MSTKRRGQVPLNVDERRLFRPPFELREIETERSTTGKLKAIYGLAVPYGVRADIGWFLEEFVRGALTKSINEAAQKLPLMLFHDAASFPAGAAERWDEKPGGLWGEWSVDSAERAQEAARLAEEGLLAGLSVRFKPIRTEHIRADDWAPELGPEHKDVMIRKEARLLETSLVPTPAYATAGVQWVRTGERAMMPDAAGHELSGWREYVERVRARA